MPACIVLVEDNSHEKNISFQWFVESWVDFLVVLVEIPSGALGGWLFIDDARVVGLVCLGEAFHYWGLVIAHEDVVLGEGEVPIALFIHCAHCLHETEKHMFELLGIQLSVALRLYKIDYYLWNVVVEGVRHPFKN